MYYSVAVSFAKCKTKFLSTFLRSYAFIKLNENLTHYLIITIVNIYCKYSNAGMQNNNSMRKEPRMSIKRIESYSFDEERNHIC